MNKKVPIVFICEDDEAIIEIVSMVLEEKGYKVEHSTDGKHALEQIKKVNPDVLLVDLWLPGLTGVDVIKKVREEDAFAKLPTILFSANREVENISKELKVNDYLTKPFDIFELEEKIDRLISTV
jgi:DNA-binding response OmpR family regulator